MDRYIYPKVRDEMIEAGLLPLIDLDMNQSGGHLILLEDAKRTHGVCIPGMPIPGTPPLSLRRATIGINNFDKIVAVQEERSRAPEIVDIWSRPLDRHGVRALRFRDGKWLEVAELDGVFPTLIVMMLRFEWDVTASSGGQCLLGWNDQSAVSGIYAGGASGVLADEVLTMRLPDGSFAYWQSPTAIIKARDWHVLTFYWNGSDWNLRVDGREWELVREGVPSVRSFDAIDSWRIGGRFYEGAEQPFTGDLAQLVVAHHVRPASVREIEVVMMKRWPMYRNTDLQAEPLTEPEAAA